MYDLLAECYWDTDQEERSRASGKGAPLPGKSLWCKGRVVHDGSKYQKWDPTVKVVLLLRRRPNLFASISATQHLSFLFSLMAADAISRGIDPKRIASKYD